MEICVTYGARNMQNKQKHLVAPKSKPRNPFGLVRKSTIKHKDKRKETKEDRNIPIE